ncbi:MAG: glycoside hydrolase family 127 protein [Luteolibacter sp.]
MIWKTLLPLLAIVPAYAAAPEPAVRTFPLADVQLLESPFKDAMELNVKYLLSLEPDRLLHNTRLYAGLKPKGEIYGGWEMKGIAGHSLGHYLTAISQQYSTTGDPRFKQRIDTIIAEMAECQKAYGDGYIGALPPTELATLRSFETGKVNLSGKFNFAGGSWVPWYTEHKILAGLIDAWTLGKNDQAKEVTLGLAAFTDKVTKNLSPEELQKMLGVEFGGMPESLVQIYQLNGDKRWLAVSERFYHKQILDPLAEGRDDLSNHHANTQIPKIIGEARHYEATGDERGKKISENFWNFVVKNRSWVIGGNSDRENFFPVGKAHQHLGPATAETCNTYNMLKLTEHLFEWQPSVEKADYYERALYNHILGSQEPKTGMFTYFVSLAPGLYKVFSTPHDSFWCCVGSGMENHTKYGEAIYFHNADSLYINLFIPSVLNWQDKGLKLRQQTQFPLEAATEFIIDAAPDSPLILHLRCPAWLSAPPVFTLNGQPLTVDAKAGSFATVTRTWKKGDTLRMTLPMALHAETLEGNERKIAFLYGPLVLAGDLGAAPEAFLKDQLSRVNDRPVEVPALIGAKGDDILPSIKLIPNEKLSFRIAGTARPQDITLRPFHSLTDRYYNVYWDVVSEGDWEKLQASRKAAEEKRQAEAARTVDSIIFGEQQPEADHSLTAERSQTGEMRDRKWRDAEADGFIEFRMKVLPDVPQLLACTYWGNDENREFDILANGQVIATQKLNRNARSKFFTEEYPIPAEIIGGKSEITIRFVAKPGSRAGGFFQSAILKSPASTPK